MHNTPEIIQLSETDSTNRYLKKRVKEGALPEFSAVIAYSQTRGRGQMGNNWESEPDKNLTFSVIFYPCTLQASEQFILTRCFSAGIARALESLVPNIMVKWPNDLYHNQKKLGGMLIENVLKGPVIEQCVAGIGINVNQTVFRSDAPNPVSIKDITGRDSALFPLFRRIYRSMVESYLMLMEGDRETIRSQYHHFLYRKTGWHSYRDEKGLFEASFHDIEETGHLILKRRDGTLSRYAFREVGFVQ